MFQASSFLTLTFWRKSQNICLTTVTPNTFWLFHFHTVDWRHLSKRWIWKYLLKVPLLFSTSVKRSGVTLPKTPCPFPPTICVSSRHEESEDSQFVSHCFRSGEAQIKVWHGLMWHSIQKWQSLWAEENEWWLNFSTFLFCFVLFWFKEKSGK